MRAQSSSFAAIVAIALLAPALALAADSKPQAATPKPAPTAHPTTHSASTASTQPAHITPAPSTTPTVAKTDADVSLSGQIIDLASYIAYQEPGADRTQYAQNCKKSDEPIGLMADDGMIYVLMANHQDPAAFTQARGMAGEKVTVMGSKHVRGTLNGLEVHGVKAATAHS